MAATVKHLKQFEKIFLGIRENADEKLAQLNSEFVDHQEWLKKAVVDTKESKDGLGLKCPATVRKAKAAGGRIAPKDEEDKENMENGGKSSRSKRSMKSTAPKATDDDDLDVFDPENDQHFQPPPSKAAKIANKSKTSARGEEMSGGDDKSLAEREKELCKLKVVQLKEELQKRGLPGAGRKDELVTRLASAMELEDTQETVKKTVEMIVGKDVSPYVGMRVRHCLGKDHGSSRGLLGTIEIIPGRGALKPNERSVSVRWDADKTDVRGPYYTGEPCDRGSGIGTEKFDLVTLQEMSEQPEASPGQCDEQPGDAVIEQANEARTDDATSEIERIQVEGLQSDEDMEVHGDDAAAAATVSAVEANARGIGGTASEAQQASPAPVTASAASDERKLTGTKRMSDGEVKDKDESGGATEGVTSVQALQHRLNQCKQAWTQRMSTDPKSPSPARPKVVRTPLVGVGAEKAQTQEGKQADAPGHTEPDEEARPVRATRSSSAKKKSAAANLATPAKEAATPVAAASSSKKTRSSKKQMEGMPTAMEPGTSLCSSAKKAAQPVGPTSHPHESVQHFRAIISRINAEKEKSDWAASSSAALPPRASTSRLPTAAASSESVTAAREEAQASKPITWPPPPLKATGIKLADGAAETSASSSQSGSRLTEERLSAHIKSEGKHRMLDSFANSSPAVSASTNGSRGAVPPEASVESVSDGTRAGAPRSMLDAAARQQRAAENRARMQEEMNKKTAEQEKRRKELESKRLEAEKIAKERRDKEAREQQERLEAAKRRAQEDEDRRIKQIQEQEERKRQERERAEQQERERQDKEREAKELERAAAAARAPPEQTKKPSVPVFASSKSKTPTGGLFGAIGSVFKGVLGTPGTGDVVLPARADAGGSTDAGVASLKQKEPADAGPTSIKIIESKDSDDSDSEDEGKKQPVPLWAQSPNLRRQLQRQIDVSPTPVFGECKKTCDLAAMFVNHQPKRRRYDKRTSSANWGDDGDASFMAEQRFEQQVKANIAMQNSGL